MESHLYAAMIREGSASRISLQTLNHFNAARPQWFLIASQISLSGGRVSILKIDDPQRPECSKTHRSSSLTPHFGRRPTLASAAVNAYSSPRLSNHSSLPRSSWDAMASLSEAEMLGTLQESTTAITFRSVQPTNADVAELADALDSGSSARKGVEVQVLSSALLC